MNVPGQITMNRQSNRLEPRVETIMGIVVAAIGPLFAPIGPLVAKVEKNRNPPHSTGSETESDKSSRGWSC